MFRGCEVRGCGERARGCGVRGCDKRVWVEGYGERVC